MSAPSDKNTSMKQSYEELNPETRFKLDLGKILTDQPMRFPYKHIESYLNRSQSFIHQNFIGDQIKQIFLEKEEETARKLK